MVKELDLVALRRPCVVTLPGTGRRVAVRFFRLEQKQLYRRLQDDPNNVALLVELLRAAIPDVTDEELNDFTDEDIVRVIATADGKSAFMEDAIKNLPSDGVLPAPSPTPPSPPPTPTPSSSAGSRKRTKSGRGPSSTSSGTKSSSPSTG